MNILGGILGEAVAKALGLDLWTILALLAIAGVCYALVRVVFAGLSTGVKNALFLVVGLPLSAGLAFLYAGPALGQLVGRALPQSPYDRSLHRLEERLDTWLTMA